MQPYSKSKKGSIPYLIIVWTFQTKSNSPIQEHSAVTLSYYHKPMHKALQHRVRLRIINNTLLNDGLPSRAGRKGKKNLIAKTKYRIKLRIQLQKADKELLDITKEELKREYNRRNKNK